jgi:hypothetical protein
MFSEQNQNIEIKETYSSKRIKYIKQRITYFENLKQKNLIEIQKIESIIETSELVSFLRKEINIYNTKINSYIKRLELLNNNHQILERLHSVFLTPQTSSSNPHGIKCGFKLTLMTTFLRHK